MTLRDKIQTIIDNYDSTVPIDIPCPHCEVVEDIMSVFKSWAINERIKLQRKKDILKIRKPSDTNLLLNLRWWYNLLKRLRGFLMKSSYWSAIGAIFIPSAIVLALEAPPNWNPIIVWFFVAVLTFLGILYLKMGWEDIKAEGDLRDKEKAEIEKKEKERHRESRAMLTVLCYISRRRPIDIKTVDRILQRWAEEENMTELMEGDYPIDDAYWNSL